METTGNNLKTMEVVTPLPNDAAQTRQQPQVHHKLLVALLEFGILFGFWIILAGRLKFSDLVLGALAAGLVTWMSHGLVSTLFEVHARARPKAFLLNQIRHWITFLPWLFFRMVVANIHVAYLVLHPRMPIEPVMLQFRTGLRKRVGRVVVGNCITLTPGTITIALDSDTYVVHALDPSSATDLLKANLQNRVARIFGESPDAPPAPRWAFTFEELES